MANESLDIKYTQVNEWTGGFEGSDSGFQGNFDITNNGDTSVEVESFDFDLPRNIENIWGAEIVSTSNGEFTVETFDWNTTISPGETIKIGFIGEGVAVTPDNFDLAIEPTGGEMPTGEEPTGEEPTGEEPTGEEPTSGEMPAGGEMPTGGETPTGGDNPFVQSTSSLSLGEVNQGRGTFTNTDGVLGNSGYDPLTGSASVGIAAINRVQWEGSEASGAFLQVSGPKQAEGADPIVVQVYDQLPDRGDGLDLSPQAFEQVADPVDGIVDIEYELIGPGDDFRTPYGFTIGQGLVAEGIEGTNPFFAAVRFNNSRYPIESVELIEEDGDRIDFSRSSDNRFVLDGGFPINGVQDLEVTDIFGQEITLEDINITGGPDTSQVTGEQFELI